MVAIDHETGPSSRCSSNQVAQCLEPVRSDSAATELWKVFWLAAADDVECSRGDVGRGGTEAVPQEKWPRG